MSDSRYERHRDLFSEGDWTRLTATPVVLAGAGGLGSHVASSIARLAPITLEVWDPGIVDAPDLNRQILYRPEAEGRRKADVAAEELARINPGLTIRSHALSISAESFAAHSTVGGASSAPTDRDPPFVLFDCLDTFAARAELEVIRRETGCTVLHGGVEGWYGQATTFPGKGPGYADAFGPDFASVPAAAKAILPSTVAVIAALQVAEYLHIFTGDRSPSLVGTFAIYDGRRSAVDHLEYHR
jgi:molybdopterin/thiamine biosynthesis adenylyltransferase